MTDAAERAALVLLLRTGKCPWQEYANLVEETGSALAILDDERGMLARDGLDDVAAEIELWQARGFRLETVLDSTYPENMRSVHDRPPIVFVAGKLEARDTRAVAVVGTRIATPQGVQAAGAIARQLVRSNYTVVSGLAAGIDTAAHIAALRSGGRTIAVIGTGLSRAYPPQNAALQQTIATECAVISQFWPDAPPSRRSFPMRNRVMSGLALATVIVEASQTSGSRMQARLALAHGRPVFLVGSLLQQSWARELSKRPGTHVVRSPEEIVSTVERLTSLGALIA